MEGREREKGGMRPRSLNFAGRKLDRVRVGLRAQYHRALDLVKTAADSMALDELGNV